MNSRKQKQTRRYIMEKIKVANLAQLILLECELKGQISDGKWENARPYEHWRPPCRAEVTVAEPGEKVGINFTSKPYNFVDKELLEIVGDRMINAVKFHTAYPNISTNNHWDFSFNGPTAQKLTIDVIGWLKSTDDYYQKKAKKVMEALKVSTTGELVMAMQKVDQVQYTMKDLKKDLKELKVIFKTRLWN